MNIKGKEIFEKHDFEESKMVEHIKYVKQEIGSLKKSIPKKQQQLKDFEGLLTKLENMTLNEWLKEHPNKRGA